jgi:transposase
MIEPLLPAVKTGGRPEKHPRRAIVDAILYVVRTGCAWRQLPADFPPWQTVYWYFMRWEQAKATEQILPVVRAQLRLQQGRDPEPSAGLVDSQSVKGADTVGRDTRGYDAGKKINGRKRFIVTDTLGLLLVVVVCAASRQDRDGAKPALLDTAVLRWLRVVRFGRGLVPWIRWRGRVRRTPPGADGLAGCGWRCRSGRGGCSARTHARH